jgi:HEPN domain-containing protein
MKHSKENADRWLREAENTLNQAQKIMENEKAYNLVCFLAEQACQKALKAVLYFDGARLITIHSIAELIKQIGINRPDFLTFLAPGGKLDQYYLSSRYPDAVAEPAIPSEIFTKDQAEEAVNIARQIFEVCRSLIRD